MSLDNARLVSLYMAELDLFLRNTFLQEYSVNFKGLEDAESCHRICGKNEDCEWWSWEPAQDLCMLFANCTESGHPDAGICPDCISGERL